MPIHQAKYLISSALVTQCPAPDRPEYAFIGRSNVGKSSLINLITGQKNLAKTSATPGKTQLINHFTVSSGKSGKSKKYDWYLVDLPGYGYAKISLTERARWEKMIADYLTKRTNLSEVFVLIDSRHSPQKVDLEFVSQLEKWKCLFVWFLPSRIKKSPVQ